MYTYMQTFGTSTDISSTTQIGISHLFWLARGIQTVLLTHSLKRESIQKARCNVCMTELTSLSLKNTALIHYLMFHLFSTVKQLSLFNVIQSVVFLVILNSIFIPACKIILFCLSM